MSKALDKLFGGLPDPLVAELHTYEHAGHTVIEFRWAEKGTGFGSVTLTAGPDGVWRIDTETMGPRFVRRVFEAAYAHDHKGPA